MFQNSTDALKPSPSQFKSPDRKTFSWHEAAKLLGLSKNVYSWALIESALRPQDGPTAVLARREGRIFSNADDSSVIVKAGERYSDTMAHKFLVEGE